jgi:hypothetical protein
MIYLADANVLIASALTNHVYHLAARKWFESNPNFATTPLTELALIRVATHKNYGFSFSDAMKALLAIQQMPKRHFWPADLELSLNLFSGSTPSGLTTDAYLLALARKNGGRLATFDQGIIRIAKGFENSLEVLKT